MSPAAYRHRHAMQQVNWRLRSANQETSTISAIAKQYGFNVSGRFARSYRAVYGELPSATLRSSHGHAPLSLGRGRVKLL
jgi:AraC family transcriptional regulator, ethanolamine operon transcriptional activator